MLSLKYNIAASRRANVTEEDDNRVGYYEINVDDFKEQIASF